MRTLLFVILLFTAVHSDTISVDSRFYSIGSRAIERELPSEPTPTRIRFRGFDLFQYTASGSADSAQTPSGSAEGFGIDLLAEPYLRFQFGRFSDPIESALGITPRVRFYLWRGAMMDVRSYISFRDEFSESPGFQGGTAVFSQHFSPGYGQWFTGSFGWFTNDRWGADFQWCGLFLKNRQVNEIQVGFTGGVAWQDSLFRYTPIDRITLRLSSGYRFPSLNLLVAVEGGRYIHRDWGGGIILKRRFGYIDIALTALYSSLGANGGFSVTVPLWFGKHPQAGKIRYGLADSYRFRYRFKGYTPPSLMYETMSDLRSKMWDYHPDLF